MISNSYYLDLINQAENALIAQQFGKAKQLYHQALEISPNATIYNGLATIAMLQQSVNQAATLFEQALSHEPDAVDIRLNYISCLIHLEKQSNAIEHLQLLSKHISLRSEYLQAAIQLTLKLKQYDLTVTLAIKAEKFSPNYTLRIAKQLQQLEQWSYALQLWQFNLEQQNPPYSIYNDAAICCAQLGHYNQAIQYFHHYLPQANTPDNLVRMADLYLLYHQTDKSLQYLKQAITLGINSYARYQLETRLYTLLNDKPAALDAAYNAIKLNPTAPEAWETIVNFSTDFSYQTQLTKAIEQSQGNNFTLIKNLYSLAKSFELNAEYEQAWQYYLKANQFQAQQQPKQSIPSISAEFYQFLSCCLPANASPKTKPTVKPIFITGMPRSGTTLLEKLISQAPNTLALGESLVISQLCEANLITAFQAQNDKILQSFADESKQLREQHLQHLSQQYQDIAPIIIDKMPHNFRYTAAILAIYPNAKILQLRRNPVDIGRSIYCHNFNYFHPYACDIKQIAQQIYNANRLMDHWAKQYPENVLDIHYETLVEDPESYTQNVFQWLNIEWQPEYLSFYRKVQPSFTFSELQVRQAISNNRIQFSQNYPAFVQQFEQAYAEISCANN
jgi:tetratricopeptide (TPR) repeat protein